MAFCRLVFPLLVLSVVSATTVPVLLWPNLSKSSTKSNPLSVTTEQQFEGILKKELQDDPFVVVFVEESLSPEDLSRKNAEGETSFPYLQSHLENSLYLPSVQNALSVLKEVVDNDDHVKLTENGLTEVIQDKNSRVIFVDLKDAREGESRTDMLRRHNDFMEKEVSKLQENNGKVVALYTAHYPAWIIPVTHSRMRRQAEISNTSNPNYMMDGVRLYARNITLSSANTTAELTGFATSSSLIEPNLMNTTMNFAEASLMLTFRQAGGYWYFDSVILNLNNPSVVETLHPTSDVNALVGFSYRCKQDISFSSINETIMYTVSFIDMKIQPFFATTNETQAFGDSFNCVGFFSAPIWASLFVVFILLTIMFYGIMMMMDIRTMDRFDDPKGKTITINAAE